MIASRCQRKAKASQIKADTSYLPHANLIDETAILDLTETLNTFR